eukprot:GAFH01004218.1.p2 GENE.GAFH01004218.1~~GAFH01004218.1.p2  ORF type:complete len:151 (-),score=2.29 GAFH01004218.1:58-510(-)
MKRRGNYPALSSSFSGSHIFMAPAASPTERPGKTFSPQRSRQRTSLIPTAEPVAFRSPVRACPSQYRDVLEYAHAGRLTQPLSEVYAGMRSARTQREDSIRRATQEEFAKNHQLSALYRARAETSSAALRVFLYDAKPEPASTSPPSGTS